MINPVIDHKRGDTFLMACTRTGTNIASWTIASMLRDKNDALIAECEVTVTNAAQGQYTLRVDDTTAWPVESLYWDIQYIDDGGIIQSTETIRVRVKPDVTYPEPA